MENRLKYKLTQLADALINFEASLSIDTNEFEPTLVDIIKSGRIQKFEFCTELLWKTLKIYLFEINGIDARSPKTVIKEAYNLGLMPQNEYERMMVAIDDRNRISHIYNQEQFEDIYRRVVETMPLFRYILEQMTSEK